MSVLSELINKTERSTTIITRKTLLNWIRVSTQNKMFWIRFCVSVINKTERLPVEIFSSLVEGDVSHSISDKNTPNIHAVLSTVKIDLCSI